MSDRDTDDTDALLAADPSGGLNVFLGLSLKELSEKHKHLLTPAPAAQEDISTNPLGSDPACTSDLNKSSTTNSTRNIELDTTSSSDFFNSKGELVLSGLSEWSDSGSEKSNSGNEDAQSDAGSVASFTYENVPQIETNTGDNGGGDKERTEDEIDENLTTQKVEQHTPVVENCNAGNQDKDQNVQNVSNNKEQQDTSVALNPYDFQSQKHNSEVMNFFCRGGNTTGSFLPQFLNHGRVFDINLLRPSSGWNIPLSPKFAAPGEQVFTRAPNFRTPGGYRPPKNPKECRDLTDEQISEEVLNMYAFPDAVDLEEDQEDKEDNSNISVQNQSPKVLRFAEEVCLDMELREAHDKKLNKKNKNGRKKVEFDIVNGIQDSPASCASSEGKPTKRKHLISSQNANKDIRGAGDINIAPTSEKSHVKFSSEDQFIPVSKSESESSLSIQNSVPYSTKVVRGKRGNKKKTNKSTRFSFGYGESESDLSPIKGASSGGDVFRTPVSAGSAETAKISESEPFTVELEDLKSFWQEIQSRRQTLEESVRRAVVNVSQRRTPIIEDLGNVSDADAEIETRTSVPAAEDSLERRINHNRNQASKDFEEEPSESYSVRSGCIDKQGYSVSPASASSSRPANGSSLQQKFVPMLESFASDLEAILQEADIHPDEFHDIIEELGDGDDLVGAISAGELYDGFKTTNDRDDTITVGDLSDSLAQTELSDWAKSGASEYVEKFHDEKFKRQECEVEIQKLQKEMLEIKQRNAVLEGNMKKKDRTLHKISTAWNQVSKEWKTHESTSKAALSKLQKEQEEILQSCKQDKQRISQYEKELLKTVELADSFRSKIVELEETKRQSVQKLQDEKKQLIEKIDKIQKDVDNVSYEKNTALRALRESQLQLDELKTVYNKTQADLVSLENRSKEKEKDLDKILVQKKTVETHFAAALNQKYEFENQIKSLKNELDLVNAEKEELRRNLVDNASREVKAEGDRLHEYYNNKVQEVLKSATEKAAKAEACLLDSMRKASLDSERKLNECRERHQKEMLRLKTLYDAEVQSLKQENLNKQLLISTTAQQLAAGEIAHSGAVDRLQSIVSAMPNLTSSSTKQRRRGSESDTLAMQSNQKSSSTQYSKFTKKLSTSDNRNTLATSQSVDFQLGTDSTNNNITNTVLQSGYSDLLPNVSRYIKTSTPVNSCEFYPSNQTHISQSDVIASVSKLFTQSQGSNDLSGFSNLSSVFKNKYNIDKVGISGDYGSNGESLNRVHNKKIKSVLTSKDSSTKVLKYVEPIPELPVKLQRESEKLEAATSSSHLSNQHMVVNDPAFQKCLEELIKSYAQKLDTIQSHKDSLISDVLQTDTSSDVIHPPTVKASQIATTSIVPSLSTEQPEQYNDRSEETSVLSGIASSKYNEDGSGDHNKHSIISGSKGSSKDTDKTLDSGGGKKSGKRPLAPWK